MFLLATLEDNVRVLPADFAKVPSAAVTDELNKKYANKVIHGLGLGIRVFDIASITDPIVLACKDGAYQCRVVFRLAVFKPFKGEILVGKVKDGSKAQGIKVTLGFFDDIVIPPAFLLPGTEFDAEEGIWVWRYEGNDLFMDPDQEIRLRVENEVFVDVGPVKEPKSEGLNGPVSVNEKSEGDVSSWNKNAPYTIIASASEFGLGLTQWWE